MQLRPKNQRLSEVTLLYFYEKWLILRGEQLGEQEGEHRTRMIEKIEKTLVPLERIVPIIAKKNPRTKLERLTEMFGENIAAQIMIEFAGQALYFPRVSTLNRMVTVLYIRQELKNLRKDRPEFKKRVRQLAHLFAIPQRRILKIYKNGKYIF